MECKNIIEQIDHFIFEEDTNLGVDILKHIEICVSCKLHYENAIQTKNTFRTIGNTQPVLENPEKLTEDILRNLDNSQLKDSNTLYKNNSQAKVLQLFQRFLVAASILLLAVFGIEQYLVVNKVIILEQKMSTVSKDSRAFSNINTLIRANPKQAYDYFIKKFNVKGSRGKQSKFSFLVNFTRISYAEMQNFNTKKRIPITIDKNEKPKLPTPFQKD